MKESQNESHSSDWANVRGMKRQGKELLSSSYPHTHPLSPSPSFINDIDFVRQLEEYRDQGRLFSTTLFVTFDVTDLYTMIPRD